jgi:DNA-binding MarR family transcriptional regulator
VAIPISKSTKNASKSQNAEPVRRRRKAFIATPDLFVDVFVHDFPGEFLGATHKAVFALRAVAQLVNDYSNEWLAEAGLTVGKYNYLVTLYAARERRLRLSELSRYIHTTNGTVTTMINALEKDGLVRRVPSVRDGRSMEAEITAHGLKVVTAAIRVHHRKLEEGFARISIADRQMLSHLLGRVAEGFESRFGIEKSSRESQADDDLSWIADPSRRTPHQKKRSL